MLQAASVNKITDVCMINLPFYQFFLSWNIKNVIQLRENKVVITSLNYRQILTKIPVTHYWNNLCSEIIPLFIKGRIYHNKSQINQLSSYQLYRRTDCLKPRYRIIKSKYVAIIPRHIHPKEMFLQAVCKQRSSNYFIFFFEGVYCCMKPRNHTVVLAASLYSLHSASGSSRWCWEDSFWYMPKAKVPSPDPRGTRKHMDTSPQFYYFG